MRRYTGLDLPAASGKRCSKSGVFTMQGLFLFLFRIRAFILFVLLELLSAWLIVRHNAYQSAAFFTSANRYVARALGVSNSVNEYLHLRDVNSHLAEENARLNYLYTQLQQKGSGGLPGYSVDSVAAGKFQYKVAKVINNSVTMSRNYITLDKGSEDGIHQGMGVIAPEGVVGLVRFTSPHFSVITSLLHLDMQVSSQIKGSGIFGTLNWDGASPKKAKLKYISRDVKISVGDTIVTSSYNTVFPEGVMLGVVEETHLDSDDTFYDVVVGLSTEFYKLSYVYIVDNVLKSEQETLEKHAITTSR
jgi:rod shape-determining protein MreC